MRNLISSRAACGAAMKMMPEWVCQCCALRAGGDGDGAELTTATAMSDQSAGMKALYEGPDHVLLCGSAMKTLRPSWRHASRDDDGPKLTTVTATSDQSAAILHTPSLTHPT